MDTTTSGMLVNVYEHGREDDVLHWYRGFPPAVGDMYTIARYDGKTTRIMHYEVIAREFVSAITTVNGRYLEQDTVAVIVKASNVSFVMIEEVRDERRRDQEDGERGSGESREREEGDS